MTTSKRHKTDARPAGERLRALREARGLSKTALAKAAGCSRFAINLYEKGERKPNGPISFALYELTMLWGEPIRPPDWLRCA